ncbi:S1/P1 nuclease [Agaribacterium sp. ZY112]|uniref:S1/P1 nuclease n=1 Tax=Agaribacterium sp. ZY112 TaxID=3233574 RepID=UPI0035243A15
MNKRLTTCFSLLAFFLLSSFAQAWSAQVHRQISDAAFVRLSSEQQHYYSELLKYMPRQDLSFADLSAWVDSVKRDNLAELYQQQIPDSLRAFSATDSSKWHWSNAYLVRSEGAEKCKVANKGQLEAAFVALDSALKSEQLSPEQEALSLAFYIHLLEDAHQPLHTATLVRANCQTDRGGNDFCLLKRAGHCVMNLHSYWDSAFSAAKDSRFFNAMPLQAASSLPMSMQMNLVLAEGQQLAKDVYKTNENRMPHSNYQKWGDKVARQRLEKAVSRVYYALDQHWQRQQVKN